mmetsp:Transcript_12180/g.20949  ORF Transcript_12180/g.20949 Transcript_12180/m.20949 type:complete len:456 (+) Transcript_12180:60-1427(+)
MVVVATTSRRASSVTSVSSYALHDDQCDHALLSSVQVGGGISGARWKVSKPTDPELAAHLTSTRLCVTVGGTEIFRIALIDLTCVDVRNQRCRIEMKAAPVLNWDLILEKWKLQSRKERLDWLRASWSPRLLILTFEDSAGAVLVLRAKMLANADGTPMDAELPTWAEALPVFLYGPQTRKALQKVIVIWSVASLLWALWQVWENLDEIVEMVANAFAKLYAVYSEKIEGPAQVIYSALVPELVQAIFGAQWALCYNIATSLASICSAICCGVWSVIEHIVLAVCRYVKIIHENTLATFRPTLNYMAEVFSSIVPVQLLMARYLGWILQVQGWFVGHLGGWLNDALKMIFYVLNALWTIVKKMGRASFSFADMSAQRNYNVQIWLGYRLAKVQTALAVLGRGNCPRRRNIDEPGDEDEPSPKDLQNPKSDVPAPVGQAAGLDAKSPACFSACVCM